MSHIKISLALLLLCCYMLANVSQAVEKLEKAETVWAFEKAYPNLKTQFYIEGYVKDVMYDDGFMYIADSNEGFYEDIDLQSNEARLTIFTHEGLLVRKVKLTLELLFPEGDVDSFKISGAAFKDESILVVPVFGDNKLYLFEYDFKLQSVAKVEIKENLVIDITRLKDFEVDEYGYHLIFFTNVDDEVRLLSLDFEGNKIFDRSEFGFYNAVRSGFQIAFNGEGFYICGTTAITITDTYDSLFFLDNNGLVETYVDFGGCKDLKLFKNKLYSVERAISVLDFNLTEPAIECLSCIEDNNYDLLPAHSYASQRKIYLTEDYLFEANYIAAKKYIFENFKSKEGLISNFGSNNGFAGAGFGFKIDRVANKLLLDGVTLGDGLYDDDLRGTIDFNLSNNVLINLSDLYDIPAYSVAINNNEIAAVDYGDWNSDPNFHIYVDNENTEDGIISEHYIIPYTPEFPGVSSYGEELSDNYFIILSSDSDEHLKNEMTINIVKRQSKEVVHFTSSGLFSSFPVEAIFEGIQSELVNDTLTLYYTGVSHNNQEIFVGFQSYDISAEVPVLLAMDEVLSKDLYIVEKTNYLPSGEAQVQAKEYSNPKTYNNRIFTKTRREINEIGSIVDNKIVLYAEPKTIVKSSSTTLGESGGLITAYEFDLQGNLYFADNMNGRIQKLRPQEFLSNAKAIIIAGGGPYTGNSLWNATLMNGNFAYRTLQSQGYTKDRIKYFSEEDFDLDNNGELDDFAGAPTKENIAAALNEWASDADNVVVYMVDHGGADSFRLSQDSILEVSELNGWLTTLEGNMSGGLTVVYDACKSGSFIDDLSASGRTIITSSDVDENAYFLSQGAVSFSSFFWQNVFNGQSLGDSFSQARATIAGNPDVPQTPQLSVDGALLGEDVSVLANQYIGNGTDYAQDAPIIESVSAPQQINDTAQASLTATSITDEDGIGRVWGVIWPPNYQPPEGVAPVLDLPTVDFAKVIGTDNYTATYNSFTQAGEYKIAIFARDGFGNTSPPKVTSVTVNSPLSRKVVIIGGGKDGDSSNAQVEKLTEQAYEALIRQGYDNDSIYFIAPTASSTGTDGSNTLSNVEHAITTWAATQSSDVFVYLVGDSRSDGALKLTGDDSLVTDDDYLTITQLNTWLTTLQENIEGTISLLADMPNSGQLVSALQTQTEIKRIVMTSTANIEQVYWLDEPFASFSKYFWSQITSGSNLRDAFIYAKKALDFPITAQSPQLDDNHNGVANEKRDGRFARKHWLGVGIVTAGDEPAITQYNGATSNNVVELSDSSSLMLYVDEIVSTSEITQVLARIYAPSGDINTVMFEHVQGNNFQTTYDAFTQVGDYQITLEATNADGYFATPKTFVVKSSYVAPEPSDLYIEVSASTTSVNEGNSVTLNGSNSNDPDGNDLTYLWSQVSGPSVTLSTITSANSSFTAPEVSSDLAVVVRLTISQGSREVSSDISVTVKNIVEVTPPPPPKESGGSGGGAVNLYWLFVLMFISGWQKQNTMK